MRTRKSSASATPAEGAASPQWQARLLLHLRQGPDRTLAKTWRLATHQPDNIPDAALPEEWRAQAQRDNWQYHCDAYDRTGTLITLCDVSAEGISARERSRRLDSAAAILLQQTLTSIANAQLHTLDREQALRHLPTTRQLFVHLIRLLADSERMGASPASEAREGIDGQREDAAEDAAEGAAAENAYSSVVYAAALRKASRLLTQDAAAISALAGGSPTPARLAPAIAPGETLLVGVGSDPELKVDVAMLRAVKRETGLNIHRIADVTSRKLLNSLRRARAQGHPMRLLHLACHGSEAGVLLADGLVDGDWLSTHLQGVEVLLLAACNGDEVGDWLAVVPWVITFGDAIDHGAAATFARCFWSELARSGSPDSALAAALERSLPHVGEFVVKHW